MTKINNRSQDIYTIPGVIDLNHETAASYSGGADVTLYSKPNKQGFRFRSNKAIKDLSKFGFNDATGSISSMLLEIYFKTYKSLQSNKIKVSVILLSV